MRTLIQWASTYLRFNTHFTAHSCRAGWASELKLRQVPFAVIKEKGRWATDDATRTYLDIVASMYNIQAVASAIPAAEWLLGDFQNRFAWWGSAQPTHPEHYGQWMVAVRAVTYPSQMAGPSFSLGACAFSMLHLRPTQMFSIWSAA